MQIRSTVVVFALSGLSVAAAQEPTVEARLDAQAKELEQLREELEALRTAAGKPPPPPEGEGAGFPSVDEDPTKRPDLSWLDRYEVGMFSVADKQKSWKVELRGRLQADGRFLAERGHDDYDNSFQIRRARLEVRANLYQRVKLDFGLEFGRTSDADLRNGFIDVTFHDMFKVRAGQMLLPYSDQRLVSSKYLNHPERSILVANLVGMRDIGAMAHGTIGGQVFTYAVGIYNGEGQNKKVDTDDDFDFASRIELRPLGDDGLVLTANYIYSPTHRSHTGPADAKTVGNEFTTFLDYAGTNRTEGHRERLGGGLTFGTGPFEFKAEGNLDYHHNVRNAAFRRDDLLTWGWHADVSYVLTGETMERKYDGARVKPDAPFYDPESGEMGAGAFQLSARYEEFHADPSAIRRGFATGTDVVRAGTGTLHWYLFKEVRFSTSYTYSHFEDRITDSRGRAHHDEHALITRLAFFF